MLYETLKARAMGAGATDDMFAALFAEVSKNIVYEYLQDKDEYILQDSDEYDLVV